jgi:hypothetical protein
LNFRVPIHFAGVEAILLNSGNNHQTSEIETLEVPVGDFQCRHGCFPFGVSRVKAFIGNPLLLYRLLEKLLERYFRGRTAIFYLQRELA